MIRNESFTVGDIVHVRYQGLWSKGQYVGMEAGKHQVKCGRQTFSVNVNDLQIDKKPEKEKDKLKAKAKPKPVEDNYDNYD